MSGRPRRRPARPGPPGRRVGGGSVLREVALTGGAVLGVICLLAAALGATLSIRPLIFRSGSMGPGIPTGSLGLAWTVPATDLHRGDVVSVLDAGGTRVTHRVVALEPAGDAVSLTLRGDANRVPDADPYVVRTADRLFWSAPRWGYAVSALSGRGAAFAGGLLVGVLIMVGWGRRTPVVGREPSAGPSGAAPAGAGVPARHVLVRDAEVRDAEVRDVLVRDAPTRPRRAGHGVRAGLVVVLALALLGEQPDRAHAAAWTDSGVARGGAITTVTVPAPASLTCTAAATSITFRWAAVTGASYRLTVTRVIGGTTVVDIPVDTLSYQLTGLAGTGSASIQAVRYTGNWMSVASNTVTFTLGVRCG